MSRTTLLIVGAAIVVGLALAGGFALVGDNDHAPPTRPPQSGRPPSSERAPEAENHSAGDLPAVETAARHFLSGYLRLIYGKPGATVDRIRNASPRLIAELRVDGGRVTPAQSQKTPHIKRVAVISEGAISALATAQIKDSPDPAYPLSFHLQKTVDSWVVTRIGGP